MYFNIPALGTTPLSSQLQARIDNKTKPIGALGRLETLALQIGRVQNTLTPAINTPHMLIFAADHGAASAGISAYPQAVTWQMVNNILSGGAAINVFCRQTGLNFKVIDAGVKHHFQQHPNLIEAKIGQGTANYLETAAMSFAERDRAITTGQQLAHKLAEEGCNCVGFGEMGIGNTASASLLTYCLTHRTLDTDLITLIGRGTGLNDEGLKNKQERLFEAIARGGRPEDPLTALAEYGGYEIAMMAGAMLGAAEKRMLLLIDGFIVSSALLVAHAIAPDILSYCIFSHRSQEPGHAVQLAHFNATPLMSLDLRLGEGSGAALAFPLVQAAVNFLNEMASFESADIESILQINAGLQ